VNLASSSLDTDKHSVPTVHVNPPATAEIKQKVAANPAITVSLIDHDTTGLPLEAQPQIAGFSSRGPLAASNSDLLKPDVAAPGVAVLAGVSPIGTGGDTFGFLSGTSMASPHIAGFGALILGKNPTWSPATVKSAMMTTAMDVVNADGSKNTDVFATGAGHINAARVLDPGLVYDAGIEDYLKFIQGTGVDLGIPGLGSTPARNMNLPSFALGNLAGKVEVTRTLTALTPGLYRASASVPGIDVKITPSVLNFDAVGQKKSFKVSFENKNAALAKFAMGSLKWEGAGKSVVSPVAVRPQSVIAGKDLTFTSDQANGSAAIGILSGTDSPTAVTLDGLSKAKSSATELVPGPAAFANNASNALVDAEVGEGAALAKFSVISTDNTADFDMYVVTPSGELLSAATGSASESLSIESPEPGTYTILVNLFASQDNRPTKASVDAAILGSNEGNATVTPNPIQLKNGKKGQITLGWNGLEPGSYIGRLGFAGTSSPTFVTVIISSNGAVAVAPAQPTSDGAPAQQKLQKEDRQLPGNAG